MPNDPIFSDYSSTSMDEFLSSFHVVHHMTTCANLASTATTAIPDHYTSLIPSSASYKRILLEARALVRSITDYNEFIPLSNPSIFASSRIGELPIVIDTGASCSITPLRSDFIEELSTPDISSVGSLTSTDTAVVGQGRIQWDVKDFHGTHRSISAKAYLVPSGTIRLFSPQVYMAENPTTSCLHLDSVGISLTLTCGTKLSFPLHNNSNLPIMLTHKAIHPSSNLADSMIHVSYPKPLNSIYNSIAFVTTSTFTMFTSIANNLQRPCESTFAIPIDEAVFRKSNWNLDPAQQE